MSRNLDAEDKITPEMVRAGLVLFDAWLEEQYLVGADELLRQVYRAMRQAGQRRQNCDGLAPIDEPSPKP